MGDEVIYYKRLFFIDINYLISIFITYI